MTLRAILVATFLAALGPLCASAQDAPALPGDRVLLRIIRDSALTDELRIDPRGMVVLPLVGDVRIGGIAGDAVQDTIRARLARFVNPIAVEAVLMRRVRVLGAVTKPGVYYVERAFTIRDAIALAGGVAESGNERRVTLERDGVRRTIDEWRLGAEGALPVESGDQLVVSRLPWYQRNALALVTAVSVLSSIIITLRR